MRGRDHPASPLRTRLLPLLAAVSAMAVIGCGRSSGPRVWRVSGTVLYGGKPVLAGTVLLTPDGAQKNRGRQGVAEIKNGLFDTRGSTAPGIEGGPMIVQVTGLVDAAGTRFFRHEFAADLARGADVVLNVDVDPRDAPALKKVEF